MKVGLDVDFTITDAPWLYKAMARALLEEGHEVHIITYRDWEKRREVERELTEYGVRYTGLHLPKNDDDLPPAWKASVAREVGLDLMIDDSPEVLAAMPRAVKRLWVCDPTVFDLGRVVHALRREAR